MKLPHRRQILHLAAGAAALPVVSPIARAQTYPTRPITMIVPLAAGGPTDVVARLLAERMRGMRRKQGFLGARSGLKLFHVGEVAIVGLCRGFSRARRKSSTRDVQIFKL